MIPVLILAAGQSRRMRGVDKLLQDVEGKPLLRLQIERASTVGPVFVALPSHDHPRHSALVGTSATAIVVSECTEGMGGTMRGAISHLPNGPFMLLLPDLISIKSNDLSALLHAMHKHPNHLIWRGATPDGKAGHPVIFAESLRKDFARLHGDEGGEGIVKPLKSQTYLHPFNDNRARHDLDTPEEWEAWRKSLK